MRRGKYRRNDRWISFNRGITFIIFGGRNDIDFME